MNTLLCALQAFSGPDGTYTQGQTFEAPQARVQFLVSGGYASEVKPLQEPVPPVVQAPALKK